MALDATRLATALQPGIKAAFVAIGAIPALTDPFATALAGAIATAVVNEIANHAVVPALGLLSAAPGSPVTGQAAVT